MDCGDHLQMAQNGPQPRSELTDQRDLCSKASHSHLFQHQQQTCSPQLVYIPSWSMTAPAAERVLLAEQQLPRSALKLKTVEPQTEMSPHSIGQLWCLQKQKYTNVVSHCSSQEWDVSLNGPHVRSQLTDQRNFCSHASYSHASQQQQQTCSPQLTYIPSWSMAAPAPERLLAGEQQLPCSALKLKMVEPQIEMSPASVRQLWSIQKQQYTSAVSHCSSQEWDVNVADPTEMNPNFIMGHSPPCKRQRAAADDNLEGMVYPSQGGIPSVSQRFFPSPLSSVHPMTPTSNTSDAFFEDFQGFLKSIKPTQMPPRLTVLKHQLAPSAAQGVVEGWEPTNENLPLGPREQDATGLSLAAHNVAARQRRKKINERLRELEKLVPGGGNMDNATLLEASIEYVKILQVQAKLFENMQESLRDVGEVVDSPTLNNPQGAGSTIMRAEDEARYAPRVSMDQV